jgi:hypothetical protein
MSASGADDQYSLTGGGGSPVRTGLCLGNSLFTENVSEMGFREVCPRLKQVKNQKDNQGDEVSFSCSNQQCISQGNNAFARLLATASE